jgi:hypothetical protein
MPRAPLSSCLSLATSCKEVVPPSDTFNLHFVKQTVMAITSGNAERIVDNILSTNDEILAISIIDMKGNILAAKSKESFKEEFGVARDGDEYGGALALAVLSLVNQVRNIVGAAKAIITIHENCKLMLVPVSSCQILVGLVVRLSVNAEDYNIADKIERLVADMLWQI